MKRTLAIAATIGATLAVSGAAAVADDATTVGWTGACNMMHDPTMMTTVMTTVVPQAAAGMTSARSASGCTRSR